MYRRHVRRSNGRALAAGVLGVVAGAAVLFAARNLMRGHRRIIEPEDAPRRTWRRKGRWREGIFAGRTTTVTRPREEAYARCRDLAIFPNSSENVRPATPPDHTRSRRL